MNMNEEDSMIVDTVFIYSATASGRRHQVSKPDVVIITFMRLYEKEKEGAA